MTQDGQGDGRYGLAVRARRFIERVDLPALARARLYDPDNKPRGLKRLKRNFARAADDAIHGWLNIPARGRFTVTRADGSLGRFDFDAHQSAYLAYVSRAARGGYEPAETLFLEAMLAKANCFYDVGANWGYFTLLAATHPGFAGPVHAFEVSAPMNAALVSMVEALALDRVTVAGYGLSDRSGRVTAVADKAAQLVKVVATEKDRNRPGFETEVLRLDEAGLPPPDLIKLDVEDHELAVLEGGRETLRAQRPLILFESRDGPGGGGAGDLLRSLGYRLFTLGLTAGNEPILELTPNDWGDTSSDRDVNLIAVATGEESRWFD